MNNDRVGTVATSTMLIVPLGLPPTVELPPARTTKRVRATTIPLAPLNHVVDVLTAWRS